MALTGIVLHNRVNEGCGRHLNEGGKRQLNV